MSWNNYVTDQKEKDLNTLIEEEHLNPEKTRAFLEKSFALGEVKTIGTEIDELLPPISRFSGSNRAEIKQTVIDKLKAFFEKFFTIIYNTMNNQDIDL